VIGFYLSLIGVVVIGTLIGHGIMGIFRHSYTVSRWLRRKS
jgi:hypothetical protein